MRLWEGVRHTHRETEIYVRKTCRNAKREKRVAALPWMILQMATVVDLARGRCQIIQWGWG